MTSRSECVICQRLGVDDESKAFVHCPAYKSITHMSHCAVCKYHTDEVNRWCNYGRKKNVR